VPNLVRGDVNRLLGQFDHRIDFPTDWPFVILYGANGVGKTKLLELIDAVFGRRFGRVISVPFDSARFTFDDGTILTVIRRSHGSRPGTGGDEGTESFPLTITLQDATGGTTAWNGSAVAPRETTQRTPYYVTVSAVESWLSDRNTAPISLERHSARPGAVDLSSELPEEIGSFLASTNVHLIETQRLLTVGPSWEARASTGAPMHESSTVLEFSRDLTRKLAEALATNSRKSQQLDRSFPRRILTSPPTEEVTDAQIRARYKKQSEIRERLARIAVLDAAADLPLPSRELDDSERRMLWTYLDDTDQKLATFQDLLERIDLFQEIVSARLLDKELEIDPEVGFKVRTKSGKILGPSNLSSGEQHRLILIYDLLFNVQSGSLVLIDEPEISLHVTWQHQFLDDIVKIAGLRSLRFIMATHSPQTIHKWWSRSVSLGPRIETAE
jgi:ABC-type lipoprotein export system ATPase subunit